METSDVNKALTLKANLSRPRPNTIKAKATIPRPSHNAKAHEKRCC